jgi:hypothetical protein
MINCYQKAISQVQNLFSNSDLEDRFCGAPRHIKKRIRKAESVLYRALDICSVGISLTHYIKESEDE